MVDIGLPMIAQELLKTKRPSQKKASGPDDAGIFLS